MLLKYLLPVAILVGLQLFLNSDSVEAQSDGEKDDLDSAELFLRPVVIKYGHDHPGIYTWQGGSGVGQGWGVYQPKAQPPQQGGWGKEKKKKKKKKKKKEKKKKAKKPKKKKKEKKKKEKKKKEKEGGWGWSWGWIEEGGDEGGDEKESKKGKGKGGESGGGKEWDDDDEKDSKGRLNRPSGIAPSAATLGENIVARFGRPVGSLSSEEYYEYQPKLPYFSNSYN